MRSLAKLLGPVGVLLPTILISVAAWRGGAFADDSPKFVLTEDALNKMMGALGDLRSKNLPISIGSGSLDAEIGNLEKQPGVKDILKKRGLSAREFILTYKAAAQIQGAEKAKDNWQKILADPDASPQAKVEATQKLGEALKTNLFTPEQIELVRRRLPDLQSLLAPPK